MLDKETGFRVETDSMGEIDVPNNKFEYTPIGGEYRDKHHYYFLEGKLAFLTLFKFILKINFC